MSDSTPDRLSHEARGPDGRFVQDPEAAERAAEACRLRKRGWSYSRIATELGYADPSGARWAVQHALQAIVREAAEEVRTLELERLDDMYERAMTVLDRTHPAISAGKVLDVQDDTPRLAAIDRLLKIQERRARLLGLDSPMRVSVDAEHLGQEIAELLSALTDKSDYHADDQGD